MEQNYATVTLVWVKNDVAYRVGLVYRSEPETN